MNAQHSMDPTIARKLLQVGEAFRIPGPFFSYEEIKVGNVNHTYKVNYIRDDGTGMARIKSYLVQRVNTYAFQHPVELMQNIDCVTEHIRTKHPETRSLHFHHTADGNNYLMDEDGFWRLSNYVPSVTFDTCDDLNVVRSAGQAFGDFQMLLSDFDAEHFHNTRKRYEKLKTDFNVLVTLDFLTVYHEADRHCIAQLRRELSAFHTCFLLFRGCLAAVTAYINTRGKQAQKCGFLKYFQSSFTVDQSYGTVCPWRWRYARYTSRFVLRQLRSV